MKKIIILLITIIMALAMVSCVSSSGGTTVAESPDKANTGDVNPTGKNPFTGKWKSSINGAVIELTENTWMTYIYTYDENYIYRRGPMPDLPQSISAFKYEIKNDGKEIHFTFVPGKSNNTVTPSTFYYTRVQ